jgi:dihydropteroate synthase
LIKKIKTQSDVLISIDTYRSDVALKALEAGADIINDISGLTSDDKMKEIAVQYEACVVIMHMKGVPKDMQVNPVYEDIIEEIYGFFAERINLLQKAGMDKTKMIIDPGIGFGKTTDDNYLILKKIEQFKSLNVPMMVGASRKSFIGNLLNLLPEDRLEGSLAIASYCAYKNVDLLRVHDVRETIRAIKIIKSISK